MRLPIKLQRSRISKFLSGIATLIWRLLKGYQKNNLYKQYSNSYGNETLKPTGEMLNSQDSKKALHKYLDERE
jgi:hypothetical protein